MCGKLRRSRNIAKEISKTQSVEIERERGATYKSCTRPQTGADNSP